MLQCLSAPDVLKKLCERARGSKEARDILCLRNFPVPTNVEVDVSIKHLRSQIVKGRQSEDGDLAEPAATDWDGPGLQDQARNSLLPYHLR